MRYSVFIELAPPSINETYRYDTRSGIKGHMYKTPVAREWEKGAALVIGAKAGELDWEDEYEWYTLDIWFTKFQLDADAPLKLIQDCLTRKLGFDDRKITDVCIHRRKEGKVGVYIELYPSDLSSLPSIFLSEALE